MHKEVVNKAKDFISIGLDSRRLAVGLDFLAELVHEQPQVPSPPRIAPRNLFDVAVGDDNLFKGDRYKSSLTLTAVNVTNKLALYNFLSTFSGTHYVKPRALTAQLGFHF